MNHNSGSSAGPNEGLMVVAGRKWTIWQGTNEHFCHSIVTPMPFYHSLLSRAV